MKHLNLGEVCLGGSHSQPTRPSSIGLTQQFHLQTASPKYCQIKMRSGFHIFHFRIPFQLTSLPPTKLHQQISFPSLVLDHLYSAVILIGKGSSMDEGVPIRMRRLYAPNPLGAKLSLWIQSRFEAHNDLQARHQVTVRLSSQQ